MTHPGEPIQILVIDDEASHAEATAETLTRMGYACLTATSAEAGIAMLDQHPIDVVLTDMVMRGSDGLDVLNHAKRRNPEIEVIVMTGYASVESAVEAMQRGAATYLKKPLNIREVRAVVEKVVEKQRLAKTNLDLRQQIDKRYGFEGILGNTEQISQVLDTLRQIADTTATVLILGESGTGKELVARAIHANSRRRHNHFVPLNCAALSEGILESELFGHEKGAFTGALSQRKGRFEFADHGTLFLDEIGDMPMTTQVKLLRVIESGEIIRVGSNQPIAVDVRLVAATNRDLDALVREGKFREDLVFRLKVVTINLPPLRERMSDLPLLMDTFLKEFSKTHDKKIAAVSPAARALLSSYRWPGNVRELRNCVESMVVVTRDPVYDVDDVPLYVRQSVAGRPPQPGAAPAEPPIAGMSMEEAERFLIRHTLDAVGGNREEAAKRLGIGERTLYRKIKEYGYG